MFMTIASNIISWLSLFVQVVKANIDMFDELGIYVCEWSQYLFDPQLEGREYLQWWGTRSSYRRAGGCYILTFVCSTGSTRGMYRAPETFTDISDVLSVVKCWHFMSDFQSHFCWVLCVRWCPDFVLYSHVTDNWTASYTTSASFTFVYQPFSYINIRNVRNMFWNFLWKLNFLILFVLFCLFVRKIIAFMMYRKCCFL